MIDFRYHLVSIVSIFLALAVGIVLGAGPLKEDLGNTLTSEVKNLRQDKATLRSQLDLAERGGKARDDFTTASNRSLLASRLADTTVSVIVLPGADSGLVKSTTETLTGAGATIGSTISVQDAWVDPDKATLRSTLAQQLAGQVGVPVDQSADLVDTVLARSVLTKAGSGAPGATAALEGLRTGELVKYSSDTVTRATVAVVVAGPVSGSDAAERTDRATALARLAGAMDSAGAGAVLVTSSTAPGTTGVASVVTTVRDDKDLPDTLSTVDDGELPMGQASVVFGLLEQEAGKSGQYGLASDASAAFPQLATK
ncbi:copper transporter [Pedococcus ginsenosidimutans]|uniref:Copper transporter n=1 Tax=Pedococcus ginsenosidimutans TaxID=490570 RepID=A0ABP8YLD7_9MICO